MFKAVRKINTGMIMVILSLAWPTMLEELMQTTVQYIDTAMVGALGTYATAAVGATGTISWLITGTISALGIGFLSFVSRACGADDLPAARKAAAQANLVVLVVGIAFTVLTSCLSSLVPVWMQVDPAVQELAGAYFFILYLPMLPRTASIVFGTILRAVGDTKTPMKVGLAVNGINIVLNFLLIYSTRTVRLLGWEFTVYGAGLGVLGAAAASAVAYTFGGILITCILWRHPVISPRGHRFLPDRKILAPCMKVALPNMLQRFATSLGFVAFASMINALGEAATAAHTIANTVESAFYIPGYGMQTAAATLAGNAYGARDRKRLRDLAGMFLPIEVFLMIITGTALFFFAPALVGLFSKSEPVIRLGVTVLRMVAVSEPFFGFSIIIEGMMMGVGKTKTPFIYNIIGMWGVRIIGTFLFTRFWGGTLISAWGCMIAHNMLLFFMYLVTYLRGKWAEC